MSYGLANVRRMSGLIRLLGAYCVINPSLTLHRWVATSTPWMIIVPVLETILILVLLLSVENPDTGVLRRRITLAGTVVLLASGIVFSTAESLVQYIWGRPFIVRSDIPMVRSVLLLVFGEIGETDAWLVPTTIAALALITIGLAALLATVVRIVLRGMLVRRERRVTGVVGIAGIVVLVMVVGWEVNEPPVAATVTPMIVGALTESGRLEMRAIGIEPAPVPTDTTAEESAAPGDSSPAYRFPGLRDRDIHFFMIEAYGYAVFSRDTLREELAPAIDRLAAVLGDAGYGVRSHYLRAPVFGGFSWLSETSMLTGQNIDSQPRYEELLAISREQDISSLSRSLHEGGYHTLMVKPGTVHGSWPEGWDLFRFERSLVAHDGDFAYRGPWFSYVAVTDQYALWTGHNYLREARGSGGVAEERPVYVHYQLVSSHTPFNRVPPYIDDWNRLGDGSIYHERSEEIRTFNNTWGGGTELDEGYTAAIAYTLTVLAEYIDRFLDHDEHPVLIIMGDHQPQRPIREHDAGASVPVHIASRDPEFLKALEHEGFERGMHGSQPAPHRPMMDFYPMLMRIARGSSGESRE